ncbi:hypothetical protein Tco_0979812 [Tanacetum coccineum]
MNSTVNNDYVNVHECEKCLKLETELLNKKIQELLVYVSDTCPSSPLKSEKLVAVTPMNKARKVTFAKTSTTSDNNTQIHVDVHQTQTTNKPLVPSINVNCSTNASRSKPRSEKKNNRIMQPLSSNQKYQKVEAHTRNVKPSLTKENSKSKSVCLTCNKCYFDARHDFCVIQHLSEVNDRARAKAVKSIKMKEWKPTSKMLDINGYPQDRLALYQNRRDLPRDIPLDSVVVLRYEKRSKSKNMGKVPTEMELVLEQTQQGTSYEVSSDTKVITVKMEILLEPTSNKLLVVTRWFTLIVLSALRSSDNENMVDPHRFEGYLKMEVKVLEISCLGSENGGVSVVIRGREWW